MKTRITEIIFYPFLLALYFPLFLLLNNLHQLPFISGIRAMIVSVLFAGILLIILKFIFKSWHQAALITAIIIVMFFIYGYTRQIVPGILVFGSPLYAHRYMYTIWGVMIGLMIWGSIKLIKNPRTLTKPLNIISLALVIMASIQGVYSYLLKKDEYRNAEIKELGVASIADQLVVPDSDSMRDIYFILLDGYSRADILLDEYNFDNQEFISALKERGFYVAECSSSNYFWTSLSLGSTFNMEYIPPIGEKFLENGLNWRDFAVYLGINSVTETLKNIGYKTVTFDTAYPWMKVTEPDYYISAGKKTPFYAYLFGNTNEFENLLMDMTLLVRRDTILNRLFGISLDSYSFALVDDPYKGLNSKTENLGEQKYMYDIFKYDLDQLDDIALLPGKKFVYAHIMSVHKPFLFNQQGEFEPNQSNEGFINATLYTNQVILDAIDQIIANTNPKPIIILQGDHSRTGSNNKFGILNAYYFPDTDTESFYPGISPINSFRVIFNTYFGGDLPLLEDKSFSPTGNTLRPVDHSTVSCP